MDIAVAIPCYNEELTVAKVVLDFKEALPEAKIYVFDNNSRDKTAEYAEKAGAIVIKSPRQGKGYVIKHIFDTLSADYIVVCDGDDTYPARSVLKLLEFSAAGADMVVGARNIFESGAFRKFHKFGNKLVAFLISRLFSVKLTDILSGFRVFSRDFYKNVPLRAKGFEVETELTLQGLAKNFVLVETPIEYGKRPEGSFSKLDTFSDGFLVLKSVFILFRDYKPLVFFSALSAFFAVFTILAGLAPIADYIRYKYVYHVPLAVLAIGLALLSGLSLASGIILNSIYRYHCENYELFRKFMDRPTLNSRK